MLSFFLNLKSIYGIKVFFTSYLKTELTKQKKIVTLRLRDFNFKIQILNS